MTVEEAIDIAFPQARDSYKVTIALRYITVASEEAVKAILLGYSQPHLAVASGVIKEYRKIEEAGKRTNWRTI